MKLFNKKPIVIEDIFGNEHIEGWKLALKNSVVAIIVVILCLTAIAFIYFKIF